MAQTHAIDAATSKEFQMSVHAKGTKTSGRFEGMAHSAATATMATKLVREFMADDGDAMASDKAAAT